MSGYSFNVIDGRLFVKNEEKTLKGCIRGGRPSYNLKGDDGKVRIYNDKVLKFYIKNPDLPALCNNFVHKTRVYLSDDGDILPSLKLNGRWDVFKGIDDALETVLIMKAYNEGDKGPLLEWIKGARKNVCYAITKFGKCGLKLAESCMDEAENLFMEQISNYNVKRIAPLFATLCKCLRVQIEFVKGRELPYKDEIYIRKEAGND
ncbi:MAG: hypothetical protein HDT28_04970 [Clostridiales bacterium]|nr:hypothetical protein [Clostridiales bacterium]